MVGFIMGHRIRFEAMTIFNERTASPNQVASEINDQN